MADPIMTQMLVTDAMIEAGAKALGDYGFSHLNDEEFSLIYTAMHRASSIPEPEAAEPIAWSFELATHICEDGSYTNWKPAQLSFSKPCVPEGSIRNLTPLFATRPEAPLVHSRAGCPVAWPKGCEVCNPLATRPEATSSMEALDAVSDEMAEHPDASYYVALRTALELTGYVLVPRANTSEAALTADEAELARREIRNALGPSPGSEFPKPEAANCEHEWVTPRFGEEDERECRKCKVTAEEVTRAEAASIQTLLEYAVNADPAIPSIDLDRWKFAEQVLQRLFANGHIATRPEAASSDEDWKAALKIMNAGWHAARTIGPIDHLALVKAIVRASPRLSAEPEAVTLREALEKVAGGFVPNGSTLAVEGRWKEFADALQAIARAALTNVSSRTK